MIEVRRAEPGDAAAVARVALEAHEVHAAALPAVFQPPSAAVVTPAEIARLAARPGHLLLVAVIEGAVVGYAHAEVQESPGTPYKRPSAALHLHAMGVSAAHRGRGAGRALVGAVRSEGAARGLPEVSLDVYAFNTAALTLYEREGFAPLRLRLVAPTPGGSPG